jgi:hypothetical protein
MLIVDRRVNDTARSAFEMLKNRGKRLMYQELDVVGGYEENGEDSQRRNEESGDERRVSRISDR